MLDAFYSLVDIFFSEHLPEAFKPIFDALAPILTVVDARILTHRRQLSLEVLRKHFGWWSSLRVDCLAVTRFYTC